MTPKEKAKELCLKFEKKLFINLYDEDTDYIHNDSKECALIAVDEILETLKIDVRIIYWEKVKQEIEKL